MVARLTAPVGNGMWIWNTTACEGGDIDAIIAVAKRCNVHWVAIKAFDGEWRYDRPRQFSAAMVARIQAAGIACAFWWYSVSDWQGPVDGDTSGLNIHNCTMAQELDNVQWAIAQGCDFGIIDPEKEWCYIPGKRDDPAGHALDYGAAMRRRIGGYPVYAGIVGSDTGYWVGNPLEQIAAHFDGTCPQVYTHSWEADVTVWTKKAIRLSYGKPCYPIYESSSGNTNREMDQATDVAIALGCPGVSWWSWEHAQDHMWASIQRAGGKYQGAVVAALAGDDGETTRLALPYNVSENPRAWHCVTEGLDYWVDDWRIIEEYQKDGARALAINGLPQQGMYRDPATGLLVQMFERTRFEVNPTTGTVTRGRVGAELLAAQSASAIPSLGEGR